MLSAFRIVGPSLLLVVSLLGTEQAPKEKEGVPWEDAVTFRMPNDAVTRSRVTRAADWLKGNLVQISRPGEDRRIWVVAWKDPTLEPAIPKLLAGYVITDTLWSAKALKLFDPVAPREMELGMQQLGWYGNGLHDVLFHPLDKILHRPADADFVHGFSLGRFPASQGRTVDLRVFRQKWDAEFNVGHPLLFAEHAVYQAIFEFWQGRKEAARRRIFSVVEDDRTINAHDRIFWDAKAQILVDHVNFDDWLAFRRDARPVCRHYTFKLGVLLYAIRLLGMEEVIGAPLPGMKQRLWSAQTESGGVAHFVDVRSDGRATTGLQPTGEASAIAILAEVVEAKMP
jgi:hypothetical protein